MRARHIWWSVGVASAVVALSLVVGACGNDEEEEGTPTSPSAGAIDITLTEYAIASSPASATTGTVTFDITNAGQEAHEFVVVKSHLAPDQLPTKEDGSVDEDQVEVVGEVEEDQLPLGADATLDVQLEAGSYVLICNVVEEEGGTESHYEEGMHTAFEVS